MSGGSALFGLKALRQKWEVSNCISNFLEGIIYSKHVLQLIPLVGILGTACIGATAYSIYAIATKSDVRVNKSKGVAPWEEVNPNVPQKVSIYRNIS